MKKLILIAAMVAASFSGNAQKLEDLKGDYVQFRLAQGKLFSPVLKIWVLTNDKAFFLKDSTDKEVEAKTLIQALNLFSENGWEYVDRYTEIDANLKFDWVLLRRKK
jgi:hypothetical protein